MVTLGVLNPINFYWKEENPDILIQKVRIENERMRQVHPFGAISYTVMDKDRNILKEGKV